MSVIAGSVLLLWGVKRNAAYIRGLFARTDVPKPADGPHRAK